MNYFFVDFENVHSGGFEGIEYYSNDDIIFLMYTDVCQSISVKVLEKMLKNNVTNLQLIKVAAGGKNALDFQLSTYLGYLIAKTEEQNVGYYIISKDSGFDFIVSFWNGHGVPVKRIPNFLPLKQRNNKPADIITLHTAKAEVIENNKEITKQENTKKIAAAEENKEIKQNYTEKKTAADNKTSEKEKTEEKKTVKETESIIKEETKETAKKEKPKHAVPKPIPEPKTGKASKKELLKYITDEEYTDRILEIINKYKTKVSIKNGFDKEYRNANVSGALYKKVKPYLKSIGKT